MARTSQSRKQNATRKTPSRSINKNAEESGPSQEMQGGFEGAERNSREMLNWRPSMKSPDAEINLAKPMMDARGRDMVKNSGLVSGAVSVHRDSIVGSQFRLNAKPDYTILGLTEEWAEAFQTEVEAKFTLYAESNDCWIDAARTNTLTGLIRLAIAGFVYTGEVLATAEWLKGYQRPFQTCLQLVDPDRLSNPLNVSDTATLRRGVERDFFGAPQAYHIRKSHPNDVVMNFDAQDWKRIPVRKPWGRLQVLHVIEQMRPDQTRGVAEMVAVLKEMAMTKKFNELTLQNAVLQASFAAAIESELPPDQAFESIGAGVGEAKFNYAAQFLSAVGEYQSNARNIQLDGVKIPHLFPGTKLKLLPVTTPGGVGSTYEESLLRHIAAGLGLSYEQFSKDYSKTNYSSARASGNETWKYMQARKKAVADRTATAAYLLWLEEAINKNMLECMKGDVPNFYEGLNKDAYGRCSWIGASRGQVDELKETQAAVLRINSGLSTYEVECARLGDDFRETFKQRARENKLAKELGLELNPQPVKPGTMSAHREKDDSKKEETENA